MKTFQSVSNYYIRFFGKKVFRLTVGGFGNCPNRDPITKEGGCIYCDIKGSGSDFLPLNLNVEEQINKLIKKDKSYILYFQPFTSTFCEENFLIQTIEKSLNNKQFLGISIGSRADTISPKLWEYFKKLKEKTYFELELGLQSSKEETLKLIKRGHTLMEFEKAVQKAKEIEIPIIVHIIIGLPSENLGDYLNTIKYINKLKIHGIKIHPLHIMYSSEISKIYNIKNKLNGGERFEVGGSPPLEILKLENYKEIIYKLLLELNENIILYRITSERYTEDFAGPLWLLKKNIVLNEIKNYLKDRGILIL